MYLKNIIILLLGFSLSNLIFAETVFAETASQAEETELNTLAVKASQRLLMDIKEIYNGRLITVGERGHILVSDDQGERWRQIRIPSEALLTKIYFTSDKVGWAIGHEQTILKTTNAGETWELQHSSDNLDQPALFDAWFSDEQNGIVVGAYGLYLKTNDGGKNWQEVYQQNLEDEEIGFPHFYSLTFDNKTNNLLMAGELGFLAKSMDKGETWQKLTSPYDGSFFNIAFLPDGGVLLMGLRGHLFRSSDVGESWQEIDSGTISGLQESVVLNDGRVLVVGSDGTQLLSSDEGKTFALLQRADRVHLASAISTSDKEVLLVGIKGILKAQLK